MLLPLGREGAHYRDTLPPPPPTSPTVADLTAYDSVLFASMLGFPQVVVPSKLAPLLLSSDPINSPNLLLQSAKIPSSHEIAAKSVTSQ